MVVTKVLQIKTSRNLKRAIDYITRDNATLKLDTEHLEGDENYSFEIVNGQVMKRLVSGHDLTDVSDPQTIYEDFVFQCLNEFEHIDYFINRGNHYNENGRQQNLEEAVAIDNGIKELLNKHNVKYIEYDQNVAVKTIVNDILNYLKYGNELWKQMTL